MQEWHTNEPNKEVPSLVVKMLMKWVRFCLVMRQSIISFFSLTPIPLSSQIVGC